MLDRIDLEKFGPPGFNLGQKEKDYAQHWVLTFLSRSGFEGVFKGGTCLQKAFSLPRYSEDLDFNLPEQEPNYDALTAFFSSAGFAGLSVKKKLVENSSSVKLRFQGPLYNGKTLSECSLTLDFSKREKAVLKPFPIMINPPYPDLLPYSLPVMDLNEIAAEKIRAIMTRKSARDLFDLYFLFRKQVHPSEKMVNEKLAFYGLSFDFNAFKNLAGKLEKVWKTEMTALTSNPLEYEFVLREVLKNVEKIE